VFVDTPLSKFASHFITFGTLQQTIDKHEHTIRKGEKQEQPCFYEKYVEREQNSSVTSCDDAKERA
jgi:hypothetical protein